MADNRAIARQTNELMRALIILGLLIFSGSGLAAKERMRALIVDGQNNHVVWPKSTIMMKQYLEGTGLFEVDVARTQFTWRATREKAFLALANGGGKTRIGKSRNRTLSLRPYSPIMML
jgi:hypothetical protein